MGRFVALSLLAASIPALAQDDVTTRNAASAYRGGYITGPASNPLSFLNGPAYRTFGSPEPYDLPDFQPISILNEQLPGWISFGWEERFRYEGTHNAGFKQNNDDSYQVLRSRLRMTLKPTEWFKVAFQVQDSRPFLEKPPVGPPNLNALDLKLAYVEFGDPEKRWFDLRIGRQMINYNHSILADSEWRNQGRSYDAVVANLHRGRYRVGLFAASAVVPLASGISHHQQGNNIYGAYGAIDRIFPNAALEPFLLWRVQPSVPVETTASVKTARGDQKAYGLRVKGLARRMLDYTGEAILERGADGPNSIHAWAAMFGAGYRANRIWAKPRVFSQYDYASGDRNPADGIRNTFDTMYPTAHDRFGIADQFGWQNLIAARAGLTIEPHHRWTVTAQYLDFWLASSTDALYNTSGGSIVRDPNGKSGRHVGEEVDVYTWYELNRHVNIGLGVAHFMGGRFLSSTTTGPSYNYPYFAINFKDNGR
jgi:hypothetical protein